MAQTYIPPAGPGGVAQLGGPAPPAAGALAGVTTQGGSYMDMLMQYIARMAQQANQMASSNRGTPYSVPGFNERFSPYSGPGSDEQGTTPGSISAPPETGPGSGEAGPPPAASGLPPGRPIGPPASGGDGKASDDPKDKNGDGKDGNKKDAPKTGDPFGNGINWVGGIPVPAGPGGYNVGMDPIKNPANLPPDGGPTGGWGGSDGMGGGVGGSGQWGGGGNPATDTSKPMGPQNPSGTFGGSNPQGPGGGWWNPGSGTGQFGGSGDPFGTGNTSPPGGGSGPTPTLGPMVNQPRPQKPQTGGPGATQPTWDQILGGGNGIPQPGQPYSAGGGIPGMGGLGGGTGNYQSNVPLPGQAISDADKAAVRDRLQQTADQFQAAQDAANRANEARYQQGLGTLTGLSNSQDQTLGGLSGLYGQMVNQYGQGAQNAIGGLRNAFSDWASQSANVGRGYDNLNSDLQNRIAQLGQTQTTDINANAQQQLARQNQNLVSRGLGNTTITSSVARGVDYDRQRELQAMKEGLLNQANTADLSTRLPELSFGQQQANFGAGLQNQNAQTQLGAIGNIANLQGQGLQFGERANQARTNLGLATTDFITARQDQGPDYATMANLYSQIANGGYGWSALPSMPVGGTGSSSPVPAPNLPYYNQSPTGQTGAQPGQYSSPPFVGPNRGGITARVAPYATVM